VSVPMTEIILNGSSIGSFPTSQLAAEFASLFSLSKRSAGPLRAWVPSGSLSILGASKPSGASVPRVTITPRSKLVHSEIIGHPKATPPVHVAPVPVARAHHKSKHKSSFFGLPFFF